MTSRPRKTAALGAGNEGTTRSSSLPQLLVALPASEAAGTVKCRGEFCRIAPAALPGLYGSIESEETEENTWVTPRQRLTPDGNAVLSDTGQRFKIGNNNILLARAEMEFLRGKMTTGDDETTVALIWQEADNVHRMELGRSNPTLFYKQVSVCANCHRIYSDLARCRENGFQTKNGSAEVLQAVPHGEKMVKKSKSTRQNSASRLTRPKETSPEQVTHSDYYDQLFLAELAKHSESNLDEAASGGSNNNSARTEEDPIKAPLKSEVQSPEALPMLDASVKSVVTTSGMKKTRGSSSQNAVSLSTESNQRSGGTTASPKIDHEQSVIRLSEQLRQARSQVQAMEVQRQQLEQRLLHSQNHAAAALQEKDDQYRKQILELELQAVSAQKNSKTVLQTGAAGSADEIARLIEEVDSLNLQLDQSNSEKDRLRKDLVLVHQAELKRVHERYLSEMEVLRLSEHTAKEQGELAQAQLMQTQNEAHVAVVQAKSARTTLDDLLKNKIPSMEEKNFRLERQVADLKAIQAKGFGSATSSASQDYASMEKNLNNKVDYLKAQLASEMKCKEELGSHLAQITSSMEAIKKEKKSALADQEEAHKRHIERIEAKFAQDQEALQTQHALLQGKVATLQANITDLVQELVMWKAKESNSKLTMEKMAEENVRLTRQIVDLESQVEALQEERKRDGGNLSVKNASDETNRMQMEALLRRLDNERQYLKNQLDSEVMTKELAQQQVVQLEDELRELKAAMEETTRLAEQRINSLATARSQHERQLADEKTALEESKLMLTRQLKDIQVKFMQAREQSLLEKDELEKSRFELNDMKSQLIQAKEDAAKEKEYAKAASDRMSKALATIKSTLKSMEEEKNLRIQHLEAENVMYLQKLATTQGDMLVLEEKWSSEKQHLKRNHAVTQLAMILKTKWSIDLVKKEVSAFWSLKSNASMCALRVSLVCRHRDEIIQLEERMSQEYMNKCDELTQTLHSDRFDALREMKEAHDKDRDELQQYFEQEKSQLEEDLQEMRSRQLKEMEEHYEATIRTIEEKSSTALVSLQQRCDQLEKERDEISFAFKETKMRCEEIGTIVEKQRESSEQGRRKVESAWEEEKAVMLTAFEDRVRELEAKAEANTRRAEKLHDDEVKRVMECAKRQEEQALERLRGEMSVEKSVREKKLIEDHRRQVEAIHAEHQAAMEEERSALNQRWQRELDEQCDLHERKLKEALSRVEAKAQGHLESLQKDMNDRKATALVQCTAKWQKAMEELQARFEVDKKVAYDTGVQDRENEWQQAAQQIKMKQKEEIDSIQSEALRAIQAAEERHKMLLQARVTQLREEFETRHKQEMEKAQDEIRANEQAKAGATKQTALDALAEAHRIQLREEVERVRTEYRDDYEVDVQKLHETFVAEKKELEDMYKQAQETEIRVLEETWVRKLEGVQTEKDSELQRALARLRDELELEVEAKTTALHEEFAVELDGKLKGQETQLLNDQEEAINQVQEDSERLIEQVEAAMTELKKQKDALESELTRLRGALEEAEDAHFDVEEKLKRQHKHMVFHIMNLIMQASRRLQSEKEAHKRSQLEAQDKHDHLENELRREKTQWTKDLTHIQDTWTTMLSRHQEMLQTLTNYKRDELVAHRSASAVLSNEISIVAKQMDEVMEMKTTLAKEMEKLQAEAQGVEAALRQVMTQGSSSALSTGSDGLNMAVVAKKRRLNEEFEALLEQIESKKAEDRNLDKTVASLRQRREEKEGELKVMERKLVEILVGQQKQMLTLLNGLREVPLPSCLPPLNPVVVR
ncbi:hypothetical protein Poli38472_008107 [Pythium oligandrum]|uniref:Uncharacterized protein n=1 Tax=Pythium oligandrum TaxID=41045 RepID=A0A8K1CMS8_PYTOL|nr:hypothetical protein Poli38472_008107 [Pythium oligandrum]|eukprot:TMW65465.1 hypothetical protein Poli38472_008107 [Pythium oligandrum]